jgi:DNA-binding PucR family transcriptional regulator
MSWLSMLLGDSPVDQYEREFQRQLALDPTADRGHLEAEARRALTLRAQIRSLRSRGNELAVLNDLAGRLVRAGESDTILRVVAQQARLLINVELAYIVLGQCGHLVVEVQDGATGPFLKGQRVFKDGPAGQAISSGAPVQFENFTDDPGSANVSPEEAGVDPAHAARVVGAGKEEQFRGVLAVPIATEQDTLGALCAVSRHPRVFSTEEVAVMTALAAHAAVALRNAAILDSYREQATTLQAANERLTRLDNELKSAIEVHDQLMDIIRAGGGVVEVLDGLGRALDSDVKFLRAMSADGGALPPGDPAAASALRTTTEQVDDEWVVRHLVLSGDMPLGTLILSSRHEPTDVLRRSLERGGLAVALALVTERTIAEASRREESQLLSSLLSGRPREATAIRQAQLMGLDLAAITTLCVLDFVGTRPDDPKGVIRDIAQRVSGISGEQGGLGVILCPGERSELLRSQLASLHKRIPIAAVVEDRGDSIADLNQAFTDGAHAITLLNTLRHTGVVSLFELAPYARMFAESAPAEILGYIDARIGPLVNYDRVNRASLTFTATAYLDQGQHKQKTAMVLQIHINTLKQRLERIESLLSPDWTGPRLLLEMHIALRLHQLSTASEPPTNHA